MINNHKKTLETMFFIAYRCLVQQENSLLREDILWALEQEFNHYSSEELTNLLYKYIKNKRISNSKINQQLIRLINLKFNNSKIN